MENGCLDILQKMKKDMAAYRCELSIEAIMGNCDRDPMKQMYEAIIPKELRHALGEFYTSDWLAEETLNSLQAFEGSNWKDRFVDPTCGSGAFLIRIIQNKKKEGLSVHEILDSVMGIDLNPLAVLAAKTNYLLMILDQMDAFDEITLPIYRWNILDLGEQDIHAEADTSAVTDTRIVPENGDLYDKPGIDMLLKEKADVIIGNPPWVNWEYMPEEYRIGSGHLWTDYQLMSVKGRDLSFSKEDISVLITYIVLDKLLKKGGKLAFVIRQGVFKSAQNGAGFRRFRLKDECGIKVLRVDDLSGVRAFDQAATTTALLYLEKGKDTQYPVPYYVWEKSDKTRMTMETYSNLSEVRKHFRIREKQAMPVDREDPASIWVTAEKSSIEHMDQILGRNSYKARTGVFTGGANAVYWKKVLGRKDDKVKIANITDRAKRKTRNVTAMIEPDYIFPMLRGSNVKRWKVEYDTYLLCPHTARTKNRPVGHEILEKEVPDTMKYLAGFREELDERKGFAGSEKEIQRQEFHAILRIGEYTFSKYKVILRYIAKEFICAVIGTVEDPYLGDKMLLPNEKIMFVSTDDEMEAYYLCGVLSSDPIANLVKSYMNPTSISAHVLDKLNIPDFDRKNPIHMEIARICKKGHKEGLKEGHKEGDKKGHKKGRNNGIQKYIDKINKLIPKLYTPFSD